MKNFFFFLITRFYLAKAKKKRLEEYLKQSLNNGFEKRYYFCLQILTLFCTNDAYIREFQGVFEVIVPKLSGFSGGGSKVNCDFCKSDQPLSSFTCFLPPWSFFWSTCGLFEVFLSEFLEAGLKTTFYLQGLTLRPFFQLLSRYLYLTVYKYNVIRL